MSSKFMEGWRNDTSLFAWANKGHWETVETRDKFARQQANWFRIGFEPLYVDFTQSGAWLVVVTLAEVGGVSIGYVGLLELVPRGKTEYILVYPHIMLDPLELPTIHSMLRRDGQLFTDVEL